MANENDDWYAYKMLIMGELSDLKKSLINLQEKVSSMKETLVILQTKVIFITSGLGIAIGIAINVISKLIQG